MTDREYLDLLARRYAAYYDVQRRVELGGKPVEILATSRVRVERYFLDRRISLYGYETCTKSVVAFTAYYAPAHEIDLFCDYLKETIPILVRPSAETMSTLLNGVLVCGGGISPDAIKRVTSFRYLRSFSLGLKGWCRLGLVAVDLEGREVHTNIAARGYEGAHRCPEWGVRAG